MKTNKKRVQLPGPKVSPEVEVKLNALAARIGMDSVYQMMSLCVDALIKYMDKGGSDYEIANIAETAIMDVFEYAVMEKKDPNAPLGNSNAPVPPSVEE